jgi:hypothetical protein
MKVAAILAGLVVAALSALPAWSQAPVATETQEGCAQIGQTTPWAFGSMTTFYGCTAERTPHDYGRVHVSWRPPTSADQAVSQMNNSQRNQWVARLISLFGLSTRRSGGVVLEVYERRPETPIGQRGVLIYTRALAAWEISDVRGLTIRSLTTELNGPVGPYLMGVSQVDGIEWRVIVRSSNRPLVQVVERLEAANSIVQPFTGAVLYTATGATLERMRQAQTAISDVLTTELSGEAEGRLGFAPGNLQNAALSVNMRPAPTGATSVPDTPGFLRVTVRRTGTLFPGSHTFGTEGVNYRWGDADGETAIKTRMIDGRALSEIVGQALGGAYNALESEDPGQYQVGCVALESFLQSSQRPQLNLYDLQAMRWAFAYRGENIASPAVRSTPCASDFIGDAARQMRLAERGLPVRAVTVTVPQAYANARDQAKGREQEGAAAATRGEDAYAAASNESGVDLAMAHMSFTGAEATGPVGGLVGTTTWLSGDRVGDTFIGFAVRGDPAINPVTATGYGMYTFASNQRSAAITSLAGARPIRFYGLVMNGVPVTGRLEFQDNSRFEGTFAAGRPFEGAYVTADRTAKYGRFIDFKLNGRGVETSTAGVRWGDWVNGTLPNPNP